MGKSPQKRKNTRKRSSSSKAEEDEEEEQEFSTTTTKNSSIGTRSSPRKRARRTTPPRSVVKRETPPPPRSPRKSPQKKASPAKRNQTTQQEDGAEKDCKSTPKREVFIVPTTFGIKVDKSDKSLDFLHLRHPKTGSKAIFLLAKDNSDVCEVLSHEDPPSSWFIGNDVQESGKVFVCTAIDPLFLVVPYLQKTDKYMLLDQLLMDDEFPSCVRLASCLKVCNNVDKITDSKQCGNELAYRFNEEKAYAWLQNKVDRVVVTLEKKKVHVGDGARAATYVPSSKEEVADKNAYTLYAVGIISEYLPDGLCTSFLERLGFKPDALAGPKLPAMPKIVTNDAKNEVVEPTENYGTTKSNKKPVKATKLTPSQRALSKVDKKGMKSISSFFAKK